MILFEFKFGFEFKFKFELFEFELEEIELGNNHLILSPHDLNFLYGFVRQNEGENQMRHHKQSPFALRYLIQSDAYIKSPLLIS